MESVNYSNARAQLSRLMDQAIYGQPVEITRKNSESVILISKASYEAYKKAEFDNKFPKDLASPDPES
ncbi:MULTISPECIES: type II toxin-antitoxin system Phd/YefM family antitoxin [Acinetobacter calcoaceticus/baumannii complex]|uniref:type II toxin-antitoxin system Phd/YefM family antitoxin n=1 Tax=Acinetobacter calcoaceticus/baumannii complex TaxID=909768 RepID=UPI0002D28173|nr:MULTISPECIES: type II toxin-antitoxin system Phd/YefM family antitoxin [Acinetobacter calcoaceticus/baumannii complex]MDH2595922.1 type II toxin-antitoxin system Phd/YefM family antitoxin [Acinetobacter baumannii]MDO7536703.1 type II toxin-antitoxin system Phd/YefM family antitoxin [Acinetobacter pittii]